MQIFLQDLGFEAQALWRRLGFATEGTSWLRPALVHLAILGAFGVFLPFGQGIGFFDSVVLGAYQALAVVFAAPAAAVRFETWPNLSEALARVLTCFLYGATISWVMILLGTATVFATNNVYVGPSLETLAETGLFGITLSLAVTTAAIWVTLRFSPASAKLLIRMVFFGLLLVFFFRSRWLPDIALPGSAIAVVTSLGFVFALHQTLAGPPPTNNA